MKAALILLGLMAMVVADDAGEADKNASEPAQSETYNFLVHSSYQFTAELYKQTKTVPDNLLVSPASIQFLLALIQIGAKGETSDQISTVLKFPEDKVKSRETIKRFLRSLRTTDLYTLIPVTNINYAVGFPIGHEFQTIARNDYGARVQNLDFTKSTEAANAINTWVKEKTKDKIDTVVTSDSLSADTKILLVSSLYFKGTWKHAFNPAHTRKQDFYINSADRVQVDTVTYTGQFNYAEIGSLNAKIIELPYRGNKVFLTIVLPNEREGLAALEEKVDEVFINQAYNTENVRLIIPKFSIEHSTDFVPYLRTAGLEDAFDNRADFSGLTTSQDKLYINKILQKTSLNFTEYGTEASASTSEGVIAASPEGASESTTVHQFIADHPFIFFVRYEGYGIIYFGKYVRPGA